MQLYKKRKKSIGSTFKNRLLLVAVVTILGLATTWLIVIKKPPTKSSSLAPSGQTLGIQSGELVTSVCNSGCDFTTDGKDDQTEIQAAIEATRKAGGGIIFLKNGTYNISKTITIPYEGGSKKGIIGLKIMGEKAEMSYLGGGTTLKAVAKLKNLIEVRGADTANNNNDLNHDLFLEQIWFNGAGNVENVFYLFNTDKVFIDWSRISGGTNGIMTAYKGVYPPTGGSVPGGMYIDHTIFETNGGVGIHLQNQTQDWIINSWFTGKANTWISIAESNKIKLVSNEFNTVPEALRFSDSDQVPTAEVTVVGNQFIVGNGNKYWTDLRKNKASARVVFSGNDFGYGGKTDPILNGSTLSVSGLSSSPPDGSGNAGMVCLTNSGNAWLDNDGTYDCQ